MTTGPEFWKSANAPSLGEAPPRSADQSGAERVSTFIRTRYGAAGARLSDVVTLRLFPRGTDEQVIQGFLDAAVTAGMLLVADGLYTPTD